MKFLNSDTNRRWFYIVTGVLYVLLLTVTARNLNVESLWYDEAGQFFIAKGLNHDSEPYAQEGGLTDVIYNNSRYNMDPGGYSIILHFWSMVSNSHIWLRLLSFLFFIGAIIFTCAAIKKITDNKAAAFAGGLLLFALWGPGSQCYTIRAYSMELCGLAYGLWMIFYLREYLSVKRILLCSVILSVFITSRYTMLVAGGFYCCIVLYIIWSNRTDTPGQKILKSIALGLFPLCTAIYIYFAAMSIQNSDFSSLHYIHIYLQRARAVIFAGLAVFVLYTWRKLNSKLRLLSIIYLAFNLLFIVLGTLKMLPWISWENKGGPFVWMFYMMLYCWITSLMEKRTRKRQMSCWYYLGTVCIIFSCAYIVFGVSNIQKPWWTARVDCVKILRDIDYNKYSRNATATICVSRDFSPEIRYLFEYGALTDLVPKAGYPFRFLKGLPHSSCSGNSWANNEVNVAILNDFPTGTLLLSCSYNPDIIPESYKRISNFIYIKQ